MGTGIAGVVCSRPWTCPASAGQNDPWRITNDQSSPNNEHPQTAAGVQVPGLVMDWPLGLGHSPFWPRSRAASEPCPIHQLSLASYRSERLCISVEMAPRMGTRHRTTGGNGGFGGPTRGAQPAVAPNAAPLDPHRKVDWSQTCSRSHRLTIAKKNANRSPRGGHGAMMNMNLRRHRRELHMVHVRYEVDCSPS